MLPQGLTHWVSKSHTALHLYCLSFYRSRQLQNTAWSDTDELCSIAVSVKWSGYNVICEHLKKHEPIHQWQMWW